MLFVELKCQSALTDISARADADAQKRRRFVQLYSRISKALRRIGAFGTQPCIYTLEKRVNEAPSDAQQRDFLYRRGPSTSMGHRYHL